MISGWSDRLKHMSEKTLGNKNIWRRSNIQRDNENKFSRIKEIKYLTIKFTD